MKKIVIALMVVVAFVAFSGVVKADSDSNKINKETIAAIVDRVLELQNAGTPRADILNKINEQFGYAADDDDQEGLDSYMLGKPEWANTKSNGKSSVAKLNFGQTKKMIRQGDRGDEVEALQDALNKIAEDLGLEGVQLRADGIYGPNTVRVVKMIQAHREMQLSPDGVVGPKTLERLRKHLEEHEGDDDSDDPAPVNQRPVITLNGTAVVTVNVGDTYTDAGAVANDVEDGDISANMVTTGTVDTSVAGTYMIKFNVADSEGLTAVEVARTVQVVDPSTAQ